MAYRCGPSGLDIEIESDLSVLSLLFKLVSGHDHKPPNVARVEIHLSRAWCNTVSCVCVTPAAGLTQLKDSAGF